MWIIANILSVFNPLYAGGAFFLTGALMLTGTIIWTTLRLGYQPLIIPFEDSDLRTTYGADFWLVVSGGIKNCYDFVKYNSQLISEAQQGYSLLVMLLLSF